MSKFFILLWMIMMHIVDDYYLQGILAKMKQKSWWKDNAPDNLYKNDYVLALLMHAFSWAFSIMLPIAVFLQFAVGLNFGVIFVLNLCIHAFVDHLKANRRSINLIEDQVCHLLQIWMTFMLLLLI